MDKFLEMYTLLRLTQKYTENMNRPITSSEIESVIVKLPTNKSLRPDSFTDEVDQTFREELIPILLKLLQKIAEKETLMNSFYRWSSITLIPKADGHKRRQLQANITDKHTYKNPQQNISIPNSTIHYKDHIPWASGIYPRDAKNNLVFANQCDTPH